MRGEREEGASFTNTHLTLSRLAEALIVIGVGEDDNEVSLLKQQRKEGVEGVLMHLVVSLFC